MAYLNYFVFLCSMSLTITSLNSGSNGNCYYIGNENEAIMVDAGISCRETERRMSRLGLSIKNVKGIFITHEHTDHIRGLNTIMKKYQIPVYITSGTLQNSRLQQINSPVFHFSAFEEIKIGELCITAFPKFHDASDPHSFIVSQKDIKVGVFTDIGMVCKHVITYFNQCHAAILEANYDEDLLMAGKYPYFLKRRITGGKGHLSNTQALTLFKEHRSESMSLLLLGHLSKDNNCPERVQNLFNEHCENVEVIIASRHEETSLFQIG